MSKIPFRRILSREIFAADVSGLGDAVRKTEAVLDLGTATVTGHTLLVVEDQPDTTWHRRIYEAADDFRNWLETPAPVIRRGGAIVPVGEYLLLAAQGAIVFHAQQPAGTAITADFTRVTGAAVAPDQAIAPPASPSGTVRQLVSWLANRITAITGAGAWWDAPATTLAAANAHVPAATGIHGVGTSTVESVAGAQAKTDTRLRNDGGDILRGGLVVTPIASPAAPTVTVVGAAGTTTYRYRVTARTRIGETAASPETTITTGNATLSATNFNRVSWTAVPGAVDYRVWRTFSGGTPATTGAIATIAALTVDDTGLAAASEVVVTDGTANVGIGTATPRAKLHLEGAGMGDGRNTGNARFLMTVDGNNNPSIELHRGRTGFAQGFAMFIDFAFADDVDHNARIIMVDPSLLQFQVAPVSFPRIIVGVGRLPHAAAVLEIESTTQGFLPPRMTTAQRDAIPTPPDGLMIYNTTIPAFQGRQAGAWVNL
ncbi:MAG: hypothetical protein DDT37_01674 [Firmicutes bacterium]|nr:hypothetical protein [candidate division NPL-UPA2 bacterium]